MHAVVIESGRRSGRVLLSAWCVDVKRNALLV